MTDHESFLLLAAKQLSEPLSAAEEAMLTAHLASCPSCRAMTVAMRRDDILLRGELGVASVSPRVRRRVLDEASGVRHFDRRLILALAATLLLASISIPLLAGGRIADAIAPTQSIAHVAPSVSGTPSARQSDSPSPSPSQGPSPESGPYVAGAYVYGAAIKRRDTIAAHFEGAPVGEWSRTIPATGKGDVYSGSITCLVIAGKEAWLAGRTTTATDGTKDGAVFIHVVDGGPDGVGDRAFLVMTTQGQTLRTMEEWCQRKFVPADPYPLTSGDIVVDDGFR
jgi:Putative zinc-finger